MVDISSCFPLLKVQDELPLSETEGGEQQLLMLEPADHCVNKEPSKADTGMQEARAGNVLDDVAVRASKGTAAGEGSSISEKRTSRKCSTRICKPQGTFQWPTTSDRMAATSSGEASSPNAVPEPLCPGSDLVLTNMDPTRRPLLQVHTPGSPVQQPSTATARDDGDLQTVQPWPAGNPDSHKDPSSSSSAPCLLEAGKEALVLGGGSNVGTALVLATPPTENEILLPPS